MSSLVQCKKCGKAKSKKVRACSHCGHRSLTKSMMAPCRACGTLLEKAVHRSYGHGTMTQ
jgi:hypothetical protein